MALFINSQNSTSGEAEQLFSAGISLLISKAYPAAYTCFNQIPAQDFRLVYNKALCCFMVKWYAECYKLLCDAEGLIPNTPIIGATELPEAFLRFDYEEEFSFCPLPQGTPIPLASTQLLRLKAETASKLHLLTEVKAISARLGNKYKHIERLINQRDDNDNL